MTLRKIDKDMIDPSFKQEIVDETSNQINVLKEEVATDYSTKTELTNHNNKIASTAQLGHIKPDGETIVVDTMTGVASAVGGGGKTAFYEGDLNNLVKTGIYSVPANTPNAPYSNPFLVEVQASSDGSFVLQTATISNSKSARESVYDRRALKNNEGVLEWSSPTQGTPSTIGSWRISQINLSDTLTSTSKTEAATANAVKQVNDKLIPISVSVPASTGWQVVNFTAKTIAGICYIVGDLTLITANSRQLGVLPVGFRPPDSIYTTMWGARSGKNQPTNITLSFNGELEVNDLTELPNLSTGTRYFFNFSYPIV